MQITITGPRGGGSTTLALKIAKLIEDEGGGVRFVSASKIAEKSLYDLLRENECNAPNLNKMSVTIIDGVECEDELTVKTRKH